MTAISLAGDKETAGNLDMGPECRDNSSAPQYEHLSVLSNSGSVYEQMTTSTAVNVGQFSLSEAPSYENFEDRMDVNEPFPTESQSHQNIRELTRQMNMKP